MLAKEQIEGQLKLLHAHRRTLEHYLLQQAKLSLTFIPPVVTHGIIEEREEIDRIKTLLRNNGVLVSDEPNDRATVKERFQKYALSPVTILSVSILFLVVVWPVIFQPQKNPFLSLPQPTPSLMPTELPDGRKTPVPTEIVPVVLQTQIPEAKLSGPCFPPDFRELIPVEGAITIKSVQYIDMDNDGADEVMLLSSNPERKVYFDILKCSISNTVWKNIMHKDMSSSEWCGDSSSFWQLIQGELTKNKNKQVLVVSSSCGSGVFHSYWLIGFKDGGENPEVLLSEEALYMSRITIVDHWLIVETGGYSWRYEWNGQSFGKSRVGIPPIANAVIVNYWWSKGKAMTDANNNTITLRVGQVAYFRRDSDRDESNFSTRTLLSANKGNATWTNDAGALGMLANSIGQATVNIIPGGYGLDGIEDLNITVQIVDKR